VPRILPVGLVLVYGRPGVAKSTLSDQLETCIAAGIKVGGDPGWAPEPGELGRVLVIDYESGNASAIKRSHRIAAPFTLPTDTAADPDQRIMRHTSWPGETFAERLGELDKYLRDEAHAERPVSLVRVDTLRAFLGPVPLGMNTAQFDSDCLQKLNRLAVELGACILVIHHPNKGGVDVSGSVAIEGSCTAVYRLDRKAGEDEGRLVCIKNREGAELSWPMLFDRAAGTWFITETITDAQAANTGLRRAVLDWLVEHGPSTGPAIRSGLAGTSTDATLRNAVTRLANDGWLMRDRDGVWSLAEYTGGAAARCAGCGEPMAVVEAGQRTHPNDDCERRAGPVLGAGGWPAGSVGAEVNQGVLPIPAPRPAAVELKPAAGIEGGGLADVVPFPRPVLEDGPGDVDPADVEPVDQGDDVVCGVCGLLVLPDSPHDGTCADTGEAAERWPAQRELIGSLRKVRGVYGRRWVAAEGDPRGEGEGRQHRGSPAVVAAVDADRTVTGYGRLWRPPVLGQLDPGRMVVTFDKAQHYVSACQNMAVSRTLLEPYGPFEGDPRALGRPVKGRKHGAEGLAGIVLVDCPAWNHPGLPHPFGIHIRPGEPIAIPSNLLEMTWTHLVPAGLMPAPRVLDSWLGPRHTGIFNEFAEAVKKARAATVHNSPADLAAKLGSSIALSRMRSEDRGKGVYAPDWHAALCGESMCRLWVRAWQTVTGGAVLAGMGSTDEVAYVVPEGADPDTWVPDGYRIGGAWGDYRRKPVRLREKSADLSGVDPARITRTDGSGFVVVTGPLPLGLWVNRA
jgi:hypothetical protein